MAAIPIQQKIVAVAVAAPEQNIQGKESNTPLRMNESVSRPDLLMGSTYKIKPSVSEHALYITINDMVLNESTEHEERRPYEIFINSKSMEHFQWVIAITRLMSAVFRKGGDASFLIDELKSVYDPNGGYYKKGGKFMPSLVAEIGDVIERHMTAIGYIKPQSMDPAAAAFVAEKKAAHGGFPQGASLCPKCHAKAVVHQDNCAVCLNCSHSHCG